MNIKAKPFYWRKAFFMSHREAHLMGWILYGLRCIRSVVDGAPSSCGYWKTVDFTEKPQRNFKFHSRLITCTESLMITRVRSEWFGEKRVGCPFEIKLYDRNSRLNELLHSSENSAELCALSFSAQTTLVFKVLWTVSFNCFCAARRRREGRSKSQCLLRPEPRPLCAPLANNFLVNNCAVWWKVLRAIDKHTSPVVLAPLLQSLYHLEHLILQFIGRGRVEKPRAARPFRCSTSEPGQSRLNKSAICHRRLEIYENSHGKCLKLVRRRSSLSKMTLFSSCLPCLLPPRGESRR